MSSKQFITFQPIKISFAILILVLGIIFFSSWVLLRETHDPSLGIDVNFFGQHVCPSNRQTILQHKLPPSIDRPDEDLLWNNQIFEYYKCQSERLKKINPDLQKEELSDLKNSERYFRAFENHYRVEVRRTILEMEAKHPVYTGSTGSLGSTEDEFNFIYCSTLFNSRGCIHDPKEPIHAHDRGRTDVLIWYMHRGIFPVNYKKLFGQTSSSP